MYDACLRLVALFTAAGVVSASVYGGDCGEDAIPIRLFEESVEYELLEGSFLGHRRGCNSDLYEDFRPDLRGTLTVTMGRTGDPSLSKRLLFGQLSDMDLFSITGPEYRITGCGYFLFYIHDDSPTGLPGHGGAFLAIHINDSETVWLGSDGRELFTTFPPLNFGGSQAHDVDREDCFGIYLKTAPRAEDAVKFFRRGDVDGNAISEISDPILILGFLLFGGTTPSCLDAADANDDGTIDVTDPVFLLGSLFLGTGVPPDPTRLCGQDPTPDALGCQSDPPCVSQSS